MGIEINTIEGQAASAPVTFTQGGADASCSLVGAPPGVNLAGNSIQVANSVGAGNYSMTLQCSGCDASSDAIAVMLMVEASNGGGGGGDICQFAINGAPLTAVAGNNITYSLQMDGPGCAGGNGYQTWLSDQADPGVAGNGFIVAGLGDANRVMSIPSALPAGTYYIWAKCNDAGSCQDVYAVSPIEISAAGTGGGGGGGVIANSVQTMIDDMVNMNDDILVGVPTNFGWHDGPGQNVMGVTTDDSNMPQWWIDANTVNGTQYPFFQAWFVTFLGPNNGCTDLDIEFRDGEVLTLNMQDVWSIISDPMNNMAGDLYDRSSNYYGGGQGPGQLAALGNQTFSHTIDPLNNFHGFWGDRKFIDGSQVKALQHRMDMRLVGDAACIAASNYLAHVGGDLYPNQTGAPPVLLPGSGISRAKRITGDWQTFNFTTLVDGGEQLPGQSGITIADLIANPPPL